MSDILKEWRMRADACLVGGVSSGWNYLADGPIHFAGASGAHVTDVAGNVYIDYIMGWASLLLGHDPPALRSALAAALDDGFLFQYETPHHVALAEKLCAVIPCAESVRLANSGAEATMHALRIARSATGRDKVVKFEGHFHGHNDSLLYSVDSSPTLGRRLDDGSIETVPGSSGLPGLTRDLVITLPFNDADAFERVLSRYGQDIAAVILEPIAFNMGCVTPDPGFLDLIRRVTTEQGAILVFDEILTGFRVALGGAQALYGVQPDLVCLGKGMGCGMPIAAVAGRRDLMNELAPLGRAEMSGTNTGRILAVKGALAALNELSRGDAYIHFDRLTSMLADGMSDLFSRHGIPAWVDGDGGRIAAYIGLEERPRDLRDIVGGWNKNYHEALRVALTETNKLYGFFNALPYSPESMTISTAHTPQDIYDTLELIEHALKRLPYCRE